MNALPEGLLYATDSPWDKDYIFLLNPNTGELKEIMPIAGSCIYGCTWKDRYVFKEKAPVLRLRLEHTQTDAKPSAMKLASTIVQSQTAQIASSVVHSSEIVVIFAGEIIKSWL